MDLKEITLRPAKQKDKKFLFDLFATTKELETAALAGNEAQKKTFLQMQFDAQTKYYQQFNKKASFDILQYKKLNIGRLNLYRGKEEIRVIDISILPEYRNKGIGTFLLKKIIEEAKKDKKKVSLHVVMYNNRAINLYEQLGFQKIEDEGPSFLMEWRHDLRKKLKKSE